MNKIDRWARLLGYLLVGVLASSVLADEGQWCSHQDSAMGTSVTLEFSCENERQKHAVITGVMEIMAQVNKDMSPYVADSPLAKINREGWRNPQVVPKTLFSLVEQALAYSVASEGAFDITYASVGSAYNYRKEQQPNPQRRKQLAALIDYRGVILDSAKRTIALRNKGMKIDLGGIAKGYAVDRAIAYLKQQGITNGMVSAGGDTRLLGDRGGRPWMLGIKNPRGEGHIVSLPLSDVAVSTSGDYERYFIDAEGKRQHHILNPETGRSATGIRSVTIIAPNAIQTDALSTSVFVMGIRKGLSYINRLPNVSAIIIDEQSKLHYSADLVRAVAE